MPPATPLSILDEILVKTRETIQLDQSRHSLSEVRAMAADAPKPRGFCAALESGDQVQLIAEVKRASPSAGLIRDDFEPIELAQAYKAGGAACLSVLTDAPFFQGSLQYLRDVSFAVELPTLRKDFIIDEYQIYQARAAGASCVLLIAECLSAPRLKELHSCAVSLGMETLIELYEPKNVDAVLATGTRLVGVNNRNLKNFRTDLRHTIRVGRSVPKDRLLVGESGIRTADDVETLRLGGVKAVLVGESLMRQPDVAEATRQLLGRAST